MTEMTGVEGMWVADRLATPEQVTAFRFAVRKGPITVAGVTWRWQPVKRAPGEAPTPVHDGRHGATCLVCFPVTA
jgi:hypothetical protein